MRIKLDENFGARTDELFRSAGHDVETVRHEQLSGCTDAELYARCSREKRCLVTLDLDFADILRFPPAASSGIVVLRLPRNPSFSALQMLVRQFLHTAGLRPLAGNLWIVEPGRIRIHDLDADDNC